MILLWVELIFPVTFVLMLFPMIFLGRNENPLLPFCLERGLDAGNIVLRSLKPQFQIDSGRIYSEFHLV